MEQSVGKYSELVLHDFYFVDTNCCSTLKLDFLSVGKRVCCFQCVTGGIYFFIIVEPVSKVQTQRCILNIAGA